MKATNATRHTTMSIARVDRLVKANKITVRQLSADGRCSITWTATGYRHTSIVG